MAEFDGWLSLEETATYLGMGKTALYAMARENRIPARKIGKKWIFEKSGLDQWVRTARPPQSFSGPERIRRYSRFQLDAAKPG